jgi:hypothetical protein
MGCLRSVVRSKPDLHPAAVAHIDPRLAVVKVGFTPAKITFAEMRASGVHGLLIYFSDPQARIGTGQRNALFGSSPRW